MENRINIYLDKIIDFLVEDTFIVNHFIKLPYADKPIVIDYTLLRSFNPPIGFTLYCHQMYNINIHHIYLWNKYRKIIIERLHLMGRHHEITSIR
jgi:hypothetical protein